MASSIEQAKELKALLEQQNKLMSEQTKMLKTQMGFMRQLADTVRQMNIESLGRGIEEMSGAVKNAGDAIEELGGGQQTMEKMLGAAEEGVDNLDAMGKAAERFGRKMLKLAPIVGTIEGMVSGFRLTRNAVGGLINITTGLVSSLFNLSASIISVPFKMLYGLMDMVGQGSGELRRQFEEIRTTFGDLGSNEGKALVDSWRNISHFGGKLAETGLSVFRTMGNMAESMEALRNIADQMGPLFHNFQQQLVEGGERIFAYQKGLGLTEDGLRAVTETAQRAGTTFQEVGREITSTAFAMGDSFGINGKLISRDVGTMMSDFEHFGSLGVKELTQVSVYARKLGVEIEKLTGALDQFADFDKAAESVAQLSQAFGLQLDTLELVQEQDPAANIERLRKAFFAAGKSIETMTRQERALLATQTGLDEKTASLVFSQESQALSYADIQKQGANAEKQGLSQAEAMKALADSIERLVKTGPKLQGGFFDIFMQGFSKGTRWTKEFRGVMISLRRSMRATWMAGRQVGQLFVKNFPGVRDVLTGIAELFEPRRFKKMLNGVVGAFKDFFKDMTDNPDTALPNLLEKLKKSFFSWFDTSTPAGRKIIGGFKTFLKAITSIFAQLLKYAVKGMTEVFKGITSFIKGDPVGAVKGAASGAASGVMGFLREVFEPLISFFTSTEGKQMLKDLWASFAGMLSTAWGFIAPKITDWLKTKWKTIVLVLAGPALLGGLVRGVGLSIAGALTKALAGGLGGFMRKAPAMLSGAFSKLGTTANAGSITAGGRNASALAGATGGAGEAVRSSRRVKVSPADVANMVLLAAVITVGLIGIAAAMTGLASIIQTEGITPESIKSAGITMLAAGAVMLELAGTIGILAAAGTVLTGPGALAVAAGVLGIMAVAGVIALGAKEIITSFESVKSAEVNKTAKIMGTATLLFLAAGAVTAVAGAVGGTILASFGVGAIAVVAGMETLREVILAMVGTMKDVISQINSIQLRRGIERKLDVFTNVLTAIGGFAANIGGIIEATSPGFVDLIRGGEPMTKRIEKVVDLVKQMGDSMNSVITNLVDQASRLGGLDDTAMEKASFLGSMLETIGSVANNIKPPESLTDVGFWDRITGDNLSKRLSAIGDYTTEVVTALQGALITITSQFSKIAAEGGFTEHTTKAAEAIGEILRAIGSLARNMTMFISREYSSVDPETLRKLAPMFGEVIDSVLTAIVGTGGSNIFSAMTDTIKMVTESVSGLDRSQLSALKTASPIIEATFTAISSIAALIGNIGLGNAVKGTPEQTEQQISQLIRVVNAITYGIGNNLTSIIKSLVNSFSGLTKGQAGSIKSGAGALIGIFEAMDSLLNSSAINAFSGGDTEKIRTNISLALSGMLKILNGGGDMTGILQFTSYAPVWLNKIGESVQPLSESIPSFIEALRLTKGIFTAIGTVFGEELMTEVALLEGDSLSRTKDGVIAMVDHLGDIDKALGRLKVTNIDTRLRELNNKLGLRSTGRLDIREEPIHFHVNFTVKIDAEELEEVLIGRPNSRFAGLK